MMENSNWNLLNNRLFLKLNADLDRLSSTKYRTKPVIL